MSTDTDGARARAPGDELFEHRYLCVSARDERFDGHFVTAVRTTGIYCRPSCPARTPLRRNVCFYPSAAAAQSAGFRACKRCVPDAAPGSMLDGVGGAVVRRALALIDEGWLDSAGCGTGSSVAALAAQVGYSPRQLQRVFVATLGAGPIAVARARRAELARNMLVHSDAAMSDVAFAAGFTSVRQFNDTIRAVFDASPTQIRSATRDRVGSVAAPLGGPNVGDAGGAGDAGAGNLAGPSLRMRVVLPVRQPYDGVGVFRFLHMRCLPGVEHCDQLADNTFRYARSLMLPGGSAAVQVTWRLGASGRWDIAADIEVRDRADVPAAVSRLRHMFDTGADPLAVDHALAADPQLRALVAAAPGVRLPGAAEGFELVVRAIVGQQISVAAARSQLMKLVERAGGESACGFVGVTRMFPSPSTAQDWATTMSIPQRSRDAIVAVAGLIEAGELDVRPSADPERTVSVLQSVRGIGPWTASYVLLRLFGDPDRWLEGDSAALLAAQECGLVNADVKGAAAHRAVTARAAGWAPWRSYAVLHLWRSQVIRTEQPAAEENS